ncbi:MAG: hypothetical protein EOM53_03585 [Alphaproteobacteria bacterium]|nr:hypothetical protein [Alphaproteobacteria bacterium]
MDRDVSKVKVQFFGSKEFLDEYHNSLQKDMRDFVLKRVKFSLPVRGGRHLEEVQSKWLTTIQADDFDFFEIKPRTKNYTFRVYGAVSKTTAEEGFKYYFLKICKKPSPLKQNQDIQSLPHLVSKEEVFESFEEMALSQSDHDHLFKAIEDQTVAKRSMNEKPKDSLEEKLKKERKERGVHSSGQEETKEEFVKRQTSQIFEFMELQKEYAYFNKKEELFTQKLKTANYASFSRRESQIKEREKNILKEEERALTSKNEELKKIELKIKERRTLYKEARVQLKQKEADLLSRTVGNLQKMEFFQKLKENSAFKFLKEGANDTSCAELSDEKFGCMLLDSLGKNKKIYQEIVEVAPLQFKKEIESFFKEQKKFLNEGNSKKQKVLNLVTVYKKLFSEKNDLFEKYGNEQYKVGKEKRSLRESIRINRDAMQEGIEGCQGIKEELYRQSDFILQKTDANFFANFLFEKASLLEEKISHQSLEQKSCCALRVKEEVFLQLAEDVTTLSSDKFIQKFQSKLICEQDKKRENKIKNNYSAIFRERS